MSAFRPTEPPGGPFQSGSRDEATGLAYRSTVAALFRPGRARRFFRHIPKSREALAAEMARLAYLSFADAGTLVQAHLDRVGFRLRGSTYDDGNTQAFWAEGHDLRILAFRGSDDLRAWRTNLRSRPTYWVGPGKVHKGFARAFAKSWPHLRGPADKKDSRPLLITGHSLGGALAVLAGSLIETAEVYAFGAPRVGNAGFAAAVTAGTATRFHRYVNYRDPVCRVPPRLLGYRDCGSTYFIDRSGCVLASPPDQAKNDLAELQQLWDSLDRLLKNPRTRRNDFTDHAPINYVSALR